MCKMVTVVVSACLVAPLGMAQSTIDDDQIIILRGDANGDGAVDGADATCIASYLFQGGAAPPCLNQADVDNDGTVSLTDAIYLVNWLYSGGPEPPAPGPHNTACTADDEPYPGCEVSPCA